MAEGWKKRQSGYGQVCQTRTMWDDEDSSDGDCGGWWWLVVVGGGWWWCTASRVDCDAEPPIITLFTHASPLSTMENRTPHAY